MQKTRSEFELGSLLPLFASISLPEPQITEDKYSKFKTSDFFYHYDLELLMPSCMRINVCGHYIEFDRRQSYRLLFLVFWHYNFCLNFEDEEESLSFSGLF